MTAKRGQIRPLHGGRTRQKRIGYAPAAGEMLPRSFTMPLPPLRKGRLGGRKAGLAPGSQFFGKTKAGGYTDWRGIHSTQTERGQASAATRTCTSRAEAMLFYYVIHRCIKLYVAAILYVKVGIRISDNLRK